MAPVKTKYGTHGWWMALTLLLLVAFGLRVWGLTAVPPGLTHDEASNGHDSAQILNGVHRLYFASGYGREPLYNYSVALTTAVLGQSVFTLRITTVFWGMAQLTLAVALGRRWWGRLGALAVAASYAASFWSLMLARVGLRAPILPALLVGSVLAYDRAATAPEGGRRRLSYLLAGLLLGGALYTYMASRGMPLLYPVLLLVLALVNRPQARRLWSGTLLTTATALLVGAPLFLYLRAHPGLEQRIGQLGHALVALRGGDLAPLWHNITASLPLLLWRGDPQWLYNIAGRPGLEPLLAAFFLIGVAAALQCWRDRRSLLLLLWLVGGLAPALLAPVDYNLLRASGAMPAAFLLIGLGAAAMRRGALPRLERYPGVVTGLALTVALAWGLTTAQTAHAYFVTWAGHRDVRVAYHHHVVTLAQHLAHAPEEDPAVITTLYPGETHDPYTVEVALRHASPVLRWADGRQALFVPQQSARLFVEAQTQPPPELWRYVAPDLQLTMALTFRDDDLPAWLRGYAWNAPNTWERVTAALDTEGWVQAGDPPPAAQHYSVATPIAFGQPLRLVGFYVQVTGAAATDRSLQLLTAWTVESATSEELVIFAHLLDQNGELLEQQDRLSVPTWQWQPGDRFVHLHTVRLPTDFRPESNYLALGLYTRDTLNRLPVRSSGLSLASPATRVLIPLEALIP